MTTKLQHDIDQLISSRPGAESIKAASSFAQTAAIQIYPNIYMSQGTSNSYMLVGSKQRVIINTGMGFEALTHKRLFDQVCTHPISHIIVTQGHVDHVGGVAQFKEPESLFIAQQLNPQCQKDDERIATLRQSQSYVWFNHVIDEALEVAKDHPEVFVQDRPEADILFKDKYHIELDNDTEQPLKLECIALEGGETLDSVAVYLPAHDLVFAGNAFGPLFPHFPNFNTIRGDKYRFVEDYLQALNTIQQLKPKVLITGHGLPIQGQDLIEAALERLKQAVIFIHENTLQRMNAGQPIHQIMQELQLPTELKVGQGYGRVEWAIRTFWESYIGWFKLSSTTELLATPASAINSDLVDLLDQPALVEKARGYLASGEIEKALHLVSIFDDVVSEQADILAIKRQLLEALLLREQNNFWFKGWIEEQIKGLKA